MDLIADLGAVFGFLLLNGGLALWLWMFTVCLAALAGVGWGRRSAFRELDERRARINRAVHASLPNQREGEL